MGGIVVGYLATPEGRAALDAALEEARRHDTRVVVVVSARPDEAEQERAATRDALAQVESDLAAEGISHEVRLLEGGDVAEDLIGTAEETGAQLVVIGLRRRSPVGKLILGANAQRVLFDAPCPVLTVKPAAL
ncbi:universal stress protein [Cellulomonas fimi]|uniref:UspA domain-containing protein n=1 Tax=Cellulomonas fimi (strain ATCC 484 / DSM 20113 / JCM 1341 / CCUG 24087 / LMG 16345 / NBRC 15513 / NCIMB 8980 / NCTC 7547 / NRS-133) TaxID=590998 RepID=F4H1J2_CELFA|nr:universal stress protein [Cellulomonas fimi]AEE46291.1 UspA domain-containing protein [Cellulomonas fimi ATCC 484]NNH06229.1 universal stress protein [Cellulomonas fimi]VEH32396.1 Universal stress protein family [Cellulomonas fimi]